MALVGTTGENAVMDFRADGKMEANRIDKSLTALVEQLGGTGWRDGDPYVYPGNLDYTNLNQAPRLSNLYKAEPFIPTLLCVASRKIPDSQLILGVLSVPTVALAFGFTYSGFLPSQDSSVTGTVRFFANGAEEGTVELAMSPPGACYRTYVPGKRFDAGTVIAVDATTLKDEDGDYSRDFVFSFWGKVEDVNG